MAASKREKELARQRAERQAARRVAAAARRRQRTAILATVLAVALVAVGLGVLAANLSGGDDADPLAAASAAPSAGATPSIGASAAPSLKPGECRYEDAGPAAKKVAKPPTEGVETKGIFTATITTNVGRVVFQMDAAKAPCTVNSIRSLAHFAYFDGTPCHRLTTGGLSVLQCGDPTGTGTGGPGYQFGDEALEGATYPRGTVAMANSGPGPNGSHFFLVYQDSQLPPSYTPFGRITAGMDVLDKVAKAGALPPDANGTTAPKTKVTIQTLRTAAAKA